jgi:hypothetical protein
LVVSLQVPIDMIRCGPAPVSTQAVVSSSQIRSPELPASQPLAGVLASTRSPGSASMNWQSTCTGDRIVVLYSIVFDVDCRAGAHPCVPASG